MQIGKMKIWLLQNKTLRASQEALKLLLGLFDIEPKSGFIVLASTIDQVEELASS